MSEDKKEDNYLHEIKKKVYSDADRHNQEFKDILLTYCDCFYDTLCNIREDDYKLNKLTELSDKAHKQIEINAHNFITSLLALYDNEKTYKQ